MTIENELGKPKRRLISIIALFLGGLVVGALIFGAVLPWLVPGWSMGGGSGSFERPYPLPNAFWAEYEEFYVFASGGQQGGLYVYSIPAMKYLAEIPIFVPDEAWGWTTEDPRIQTMLTNPWTGKTAVRGDTRNPALSRTGGLYDGKWIFASDMLHPRIARVDLDIFRTGQMLWLPNVNGGINSLSVNPDTTLVAATFEHGQYPQPGIIEHLGIEVDAIEGPYVGGFAGIAVAADGEMSNAWQVWGPWSHDAVAIGWGDSEGWLVTTSYNSERAVTTIGMLANEDDYLFFWKLDSIEQAVANGKYITTEQDPDTPVISWQDVEVYVTAVPTNPSGVDISPTGKYIFSGGKAASQVAVVDFEKVVAAIATTQFDGDVAGIPVLAADTVRTTTLDLGFGPTHVEFDDHGFAYVGSFVDSMIWKIGMGGPYADQHGEKAWDVVDEMESHYSVIHPLVPGGDTAQPYGRYLIAINKLSKNSFLPHGPLHTENHELFNITETPGQLIDQMPLGPETHAAQAIPVELLAPQIISVYQPAEEREAPRVEYDYDNQEVQVYMNVVRSFFTPDSFTIPQGWRVNIHMTSLEGIIDISHGLGIDGYDVAVSLDPGQIREVAFVADQPGVYWYYCLWYCSELHKEMRGRMIVIPADEWSPEMEWQP